MKHTTLFLIAALAICLTSVNAQSETEMKNWQEYMTPGEVHKTLASMDGNWTGEVSMWQAPGAAATKSTLATVNKMVMSGRYQMSTHTGNLMGMPFEGISTTGYDNGKKKVLTTWIDNMGTGIMVLEGNWDASKKTITLSGKMVDPSSGNGKEMNIREVFRIVDDNNHVMEMYGPGPDGKEFKTMEIKYTKKG